MKNSNRTVLAHEPEVFVKVLPDPTTLKDVRSLSKNLERMVNKDMKMLKRNGISLDMAKDTVFGLSFALLLLPLVGG